MSQTDIISLPKELKYENLLDLVFTFHQIYSTYIRYRCYKWINGIRYQLELSINITKNKCNIGLEIPLSVVSKLGIDYTVTIIDSETKMSILINYLSGMGGIMDYVRVYPDVKVIDDENRKVVWI